MDWSGEKSGFRTCAVLLKLSIADLGTHRAGGGNVTNTHTRILKRHLCVKQFRRKQPIHTKT